MISSALCSYTAYSSPHNCSARLERHHAPGVTAKMGTDEREYPRRHRQQSSLSPSPAPGHKQLLSQPRETCSSIGMPHECPTTENMKNSFWSKTITISELPNINGHLVVSPRVKIGAGSMSRDVCGTLQMLDYAQRARHELKMGFIRVPLLLGPPDHTEKSKTPGHPTFPHLHHHSC